MISLYLNVFVMIVRLFLKVPGIHAPTQPSRPSLSSRAVPVVFLALGILAAIRACPAAMA